MKIIYNQFGSGILLEKEDLKNQFLYAISTACLSVTSDFASFAADKNIDITIIDEPLNGEKMNILILGCQVTDMAILNDIKTAEEMHEKYPKARIIMGGCLAYRFDISLPDWCYRMETLRKEYQPINKENLTQDVHWKAPFWTNEKGIDCYGEKSGSLFRNAYPLKIGAGCHGKCKYCTIRVTRGESYETDAFLQTKEFLDHVEDPDFDGVVLTSDSPTINQIRDWCLIARRYNKPISFRNVEPHIAMACKEYLKDLAQAKLLKVFHCPIQSNDEKILKAMNRNVEQTFNYINFAQELRKFGVFVATNIIIDYVVDGEVLLNMDKKWLNEHFDYWVWNPYFDGKWDRKKAERRFEKYIKGKG